MVYKVCKKCQKAVDEMLNTCPFCGYSFRTTLNKWKKTGTGAWSIDWNVRGVADVRIFQNDQKKEFTIYAIQKNVTYALPKTRPKTQFTSIDFDQICRLKLKKLISVTQEAQNLVEKGYIEVFNIEL